MTLTEQEVFGKVKSVIVDQLGVSDDEVTLEASFTDDLGADSLDTVELVMALEEEFSTEIADEEGNVTLFMSGWVEEDQSGTTRVGVSVQKGIPQEGEAVAAEPANAPF